MTDAVEAAQALANQKLGSAPDLLQKIYRASQIGAGNVADYFLAAKAVAGTASIAGVGVDEMFIGDLGSQFVGEIPIDRGSASKLVLEGDGRGEKE